MELTFYLLPTRSSPSVDLMCTDENGDDWCILCFNGDGSISRYEGLPTYLGFPVDEDGRIVIIN